MKRILGLTLILSVVAMSSTAQWRRLESGGLAWLHAIHFADERYGWAGGGNGTLLSTSDGGVTWRKEAFPAADSIRDIFFLDRLNGWILCGRDRLRPDKGSNRSYLMRTANGGDSWTPVEFALSTEAMTRFFFAKTGEGYSVGEGGIITALAVGEKPEKRSTLPVHFLILDGVVLKRSRVLLVGGGGSIILTDNGGASWQFAKFSGTGPTARLNAVSFVDDRSGLAVGNDGTVLSSKDGGNVWRKEVSNTTGNLLDVLFYDRKSGYAVGENGIILRTSDDGVSWIPEPGGSKHRLERLARAGNRIFAVGFGGTLISRDLS